jgi:opacity protein-like surface antigen
MKKILFAILLAALAAGTAAAHEEIPAVEIFTGYSLLKLGATNEDVRTFQDGLYAGSQNWNTKNSSFFLKGGVVGSFAFNLNEYFSIVVDARYNQGDIMDGSFEFVWPELQLTVQAPFAFGIKNVSALAGPRFSYRDLLNERATVFVHALAGLDYWRMDGSFTVSGALLKEAANKFGPGVSIGGGFDLNVHEKIAVRVIQADYYVTRQMERRMNNVNLSFGIVFRVGEKVLR